MRHDKSSTQIIATIGPSSGDKETLRQMMASQLDVARLNFSWGTLDEHSQYIKNIRDAARSEDLHIPIIQDLPGPRAQGEHRHTMDPSEEVITAKDKDIIAFGKEHEVDYLAVSFVRNESDMLLAKELAGGTPVIAKIERREALENFNDILKVADGVIIARGDLGDNIPIEYLPFVQRALISRANQAGVPVATATEMLLSMTERKRPTRAEVTDVAYAIMHGSDAVMLSEETAIGRYPVETVKVMETIIKTAEEYQSGDFAFHQL